MTPFETNAFSQRLDAPLPNWTPPAVPAPVPLVGRHCRLEPLTVDHVTDVHGAFALDPDGRSWTYLPYGPFKSADEYRGWVEQHALGPDPLFYAIVDLEKNRPTGVASYLRIAPADGSIEVGHLHFSSLLRRTPAATEAMALMMGRAFELGYRRYEWKCDALNTPSRLAALRLGFVFEGIFRQATVRKGRNRDTAWYSIIDKEWPSVRRALEAWLAPANFDEDGRQRVALSTLTRAIRGGSD